jgi:putative intracellular protease/amidase
MKKLMMLFASAMIAGALPTYAASNKPAQVYVCPDCGCAADNRTFNKSGKCPECGMPLVEKIGNREQRPSVAILLFDNAQVIDYAGPWEVFGEAGFKVFTVAEKSAPINAVFGQKIVPDYTFANSPTADVLLIPGGSVRSAVGNPQLIKWVQTNAQKSKHVMSVCTGAFILSKAGLLDGLSATTIQHAIDDLQKVSPKTKVVHDQRYVDNGKIMTTAGLSSGIDGAFHLVARMNGEGEAQAIALGMEYQWDPHSKYARAALPDKFLPDVPDIKGIRAKTLSTEGDLDHWETRTLISEPNSPEAIVDLINKRITSREFQPKGTATLSPAGANKSASSWKFTDDQGQTWSGEAVVAPAAEEQGKFTATLKLARQPDNKSI